MRLLKVVCALLALGVSAAYAGYAQVAPPAGFATSPQGWTYRAAANEAWTAAKTVRTTGSLSVAGRAVAMPAAMRMAANAPLFAARAMFLNPWTAAALIAAPVAYQWAQSKGFFYEEGQWVRTNPDACTATVCTEYADAYHGVWHGSLGAACVQSAAGYGAVDPNISVGVTGYGGTTCSFQQTLKNPSPGQPNPPIPFSITVQTRQVPGTEPTKLPVTQPEFEEELAPTEMPWQVPNEVPFNVPVEKPVLNPSPGAEPVAEPMRVPTGQPQPVANTDPQQYRQPVVRIDPANTPQKPWQVDVNPETVQTDDPLGLPDPDPAPNEETQQDFCTKNPGSIVCEQGDVTDTGLPQVPKLYEPKYPDGLVGVWNAKKAELDATPISNVLTKLMPTGLQGGGYPVFMIDMDMGVANFGQFDFSVPDYVWDFAGLVMVLSALLLARRLIFGG